MKKRIARIMIVLTALSGLSLLGAIPSAQAHHRGGHHCRWRPHTHSAEFFERKREQGKQRQIRKHRHHAHQCRGPHVYPPG